MVEKRYVQVSHYFVVKAMVASDTRKGTRNLVVDITPTSLPLRENQFSLDR